MTRECDIDRDCMVIIGKMMAGTATPADIAEMQSLSAARARLMQHRCRVVIGPNGREIITERKCRCRDGEDRWL